MHLAGATYDEAYATFRWDIPARFNIAHAISERHAASDPAKVALIAEAADGSVRDWSRGEIETAACRLANALVTFGLGRGVIAAIHLPQSAESVIAHIAVQKCGAIALPLFNLFGPDALRFRLIDSGAEVLISTVDGLQRAAADLAGIETLKHVISVDGAGPLGAREFWSVVDAGATGFRGASTAPDDPAILMYTSGTTGQPKGVLHGGRVVIGHLPGVMMPHDFFPQPGDRFWTPADWAWAGGLLDVMLPSLYHGVPLVAARRPKFDPEWAFAFLAKHQIRNVFMPPTALRLMRSVAAPRSRHAYDLRSLGTGGEKAGEDLLAWGRETFGLDISEFYGQTEANLVVGNSPKLFPVRPGSMGRAIPGHTVEIVDDSGRVLPPGEVGIVAVKRPDPVMFLEYWKRPDATAEKFRGDWMLLGDVAVKDADGYFWYRGRDDDLINSAGYRIGPGEVEECLARHPAVQLAGVIGSPDAIRGEIVTAYIALKPDHAASEALAAEIQAFVRARLAAHEYPRKIRFVDELPMTVTGKVRRVDLRSLDAKERAGRS